MYHHVYHHVCYSSSLVSWGGDWHIRESETPAALTGLAMTVSALRSTRGTVVAGGHVMVDDELCVVSIGIVWLVSDVDAPTSALSTGNETESLPKNATRQLRCIMPVVVGVAGVLFNVLFDAWHKRWTKISKKITKIKIHKNP
jgi:hypothetical protein